MGKSTEYIQGIKPQFKKRYFAPPHDDNFVGYGVSNLRVMRDRHAKRFKVRTDESLDDLCLFVMLREAPNDRSELPSKYEGVRVFYDIVGAIEPSRRV